MFLITFVARMSSHKIRLVIVDDHQMLIDGIKSLLKNEPLFEVVGESTSSVKAIELIKELKPDILLTDINMPELDGIELTKRVKPVLPEMKVLVLSMFNDKSMISEMMNAGADGYILKNTGRDELVEALTKLNQGGMFFSNDVASEMMRSIAQQTKPEPQRIINLTEREIEIVKLIAEEFSNAQIAQKLFISERTVETHRKNILRKTGTHNALSLVKYAMEYGIV
jgi:DNA-binding NarL/FixJ family response regulator